MPLSQGGTLTDQQAWDVAYYVNAHERPQDPRFSGNLQETINKHHGGKYDLYGHEINGKVLGANSTPHGGRLNAKK
jgi:thiosulfate dehydrogenase